MSKKLILLTVLIISGALCVNAAGVSSLKPIDDKNDSKPVDTSGLDKETIYYPNANIKSAISKYKSGNYSGCLQELFSLTKMDPSNALAYYYMAMAFAQADMRTEAIDAYEKVLALNPNPYLAQYATRGRDCLTGGPACASESQSVEGQDDLDRFINAPYGNGLSPEINEEIRQKQLVKIKETINNKNELENKDIEEIKEYDQKNSKSSIEDNDRIAQVSDEELLDAIKTLRKAGLTVNIQSENFAQYQDPQMAELSMMLGGNNNNSMMNYVPMLMAQNYEGKNIDPRLMQAMMMNSMMAGFDSNNNNNRY